MEFLPPNAEEFELETDLQTAIEAASHAFWEAGMAERYKYREYDEEEDFEDRAEFTARELAFASKVLGGVSTMLERHDGAITVLFDVDETIGKLKAKPDDTHHTVTRPALAPVAQAIAETAGERVRYGLLSSRGQSYLDAEAQKRAYTAALGEAFDPQFVVSSRDGKTVANTRARDLKNWGDTHMQLEAISHIVDPAISPDTEIHWNWFDEKLVVLNQLHQDHPDQGFVMVDDLEFVKAIDPDHPQVYGVHLDVDARFYC